MATGDVSKALLLDGKASNLSEYVVGCVRCHESFHSIHQLPYSGRCGHSQCKDCASKESICPVSDCRSVGSFRDPWKNFLVTELLEFIEEEEEKIIAEKKGIDEVTAEFSMATLVSPEIPLATANDNTSLYLNCKKESDLDPILDVSGQLSFDGAEPATFEQCKGGGGDMKAAESMESIATLDTLSLNYQNRRALELPPVVWNITVGNVDSSVDFSKLSSLFSKMGTIRALIPSRVANNSYDIQLSPNL